MRRPGATVAVRARRVPTAVGVVILALLYYGSARLGLSQGYLDGNVTPVWPPTGLSIAALVLFGRRFWPGVALGALAVNGLTTVPLGAAMGMSAGNTAEALLAAVLLERAGFRPTLERVRDVFLLIGLGSGLATMVSATAGVLSLRLAGVVPWDEVAGTWRVWWLGDAMGCLIVAPFLFAGFAGTRRGAGRAPEAALLGLAVVLSTLAGFGAPWTRPFVVFPAVVWASLRFTQPGVAVTSLVISALAVVRTVHGYGPFAEPDAVRSLLLLDGFLAVMAITGLALAAVVSERDRAGELLRIAHDSVETRFALSFENAPIGMALVGLDGRWLRVNRRLCEIVGHPAAELLTKTFQDITHPDDLGADLDLLHQTLAGTITGYSMEKRYFHADGHPVWINLSVSLVRDESGAAVHFISQIEDITARKTHELALQHNHDLLEGSQSLGRTGSWEWDASAGPAGGLTWSKGMYQIHGLDPGSAVSLESVVGLIHPDDRPEYQRRIAGATAAGPVPGIVGFTYRTVRPDGTVRWIWTQASTAPDRPSLVIGFAQDITERREADERFRALLESAPDAMVIVDDGGVIVLVNRQAESLFGYSRQDMVGEPVEMLLPEHVRNAHRGARAEYAAHPTARPMGGELELLGRRADGTEFPVEVSLSPLRTDQGMTVSAAVRDISARKQAEAALAHQALHDALTGLPNRILLADRLDLALARAARADTGVAVLFVDLDRFKLINDTRGHATGDQVLQALAERLLAVVRPGDTVARFGGDEFVVICENTMAAWEATMLGERISEAVRRPFDVDGDEVFLSVSVGIAVADPGVDGPDRARSSSELLRDADGAMYRAKERGRGGVEFFDESMRTQAAARLDTLNALHRAINRQELRVFYQPVVDLQSGAMVGAEALLRWLHPERGLIGPSEFVPVAEETGLIIPIGSWVLEESCRQWAQWRTGHPNQTLPSIAVNLSARQLRQIDLLGVVRSTLNRHGVDPAALCFELTESVLMDDIVLDPGTLRALRELGVSLAIDDFGTGYSSLTYLKRFPVSVIKIDQHFVAGLGHDAFDTAIVESTIELAHSLGLRVTAEGVETAEQFDRLRNLGCDLAQGYYIAPPQEPAALDALVGLGTDAFQALRR